KYVLTYFCRQPVVYQETEMDRALKIVATVLGAFMVLNGIMKIAGAEKVAANMAQIHFTGAALTFQGVVELAAGLIAIVPRTRSLGLAGMMAIFIGAIGAHLGAGQTFDKAVPAAVALVVTSLVFVALNRKTLP